MPVSLESLLAAYGSGQGGATPTGLPDDDERRRRAQEQLAAKVAAILGSDAPVEAQQEALGIAQGEDGESDSVLNTIFRAVSAPVSAVTGALGEINDWAVEHAPSVYIGGSDPENEYALAPTALIGGTLPAITEMIKGSGDGDWTGAVLNTKRDEEGELRRGSVEDFKEHFNAREGYGAVLRNSGQSSGNEWVDRGAGLTGDLVLDPLNALGGQGALNRLGSRGVARLAADVGDEALVSKAFRGVSNLSDDELARLSTKGMEAGLIDEPLKGGTYFAGQQVIPRNPLQTGAARTFRGAEEAIRASAPGQGVRKLLGGDETKAALTRMARSTDDPTLASAAFAALEGWSRGRLAKSAYRQGARAAMEETLGEFGDIAPDDITKILAVDDVDYTAQLLGVDALRADEINRGLRKFDKRTLDLANEQVPDEALKFVDRPDHTYVELSEEMADKVSRRPQGSYFDAAGNELKANIVAGGEFRGQRILPTTARAQERAYLDEVKKLIDEGVVDPAATPDMQAAQAAQAGVAPLPLSPDDPITQANKIAQEQLGDDAAELFSMNYWSAADRAISSRANRVQAKVIESELRKRGYADDIWGTFLTPTAGESRAARLRMEMADKLLERKAGRAAAKRMTAQADEAAQTAASSGKVAARDQAAAGRAWQEADAFATSTRLTRTLIDTSQGKIDDAIAQSKAWQRGMDDMLAQGEAEVASLEARMGAARTQYDDAAVEVERAYGGVDSRLDAAVERAELKGTQADLQRKIGRDKSQRPPNLAKAEKALAEAEDELAEVSGGIIASGRSLDEVAAARSEVAQELGRLRTQRNGIQQRLDQIARVAERDPSNATYLDLVSEAAKVERNISRMRRFSQILRQERRVIKDTIEATPEGIRRKVLRDKVQQAYTRRDLRIEQRSAELRGVEDRLRTLGDDEAADRVSALAARLEEIETTKGVLRNKNGGVWAHGTAVDELDPFTDVVDDAARGATGDIDNEFALHFFDRPEYAQAWSTQYNTAAEPKWVEVEIRSNNPKVYDDGVDDVFPDETWMPPGDPFETVGAGVPVQGWGKGEMHGDVLKAGIKRRAIDPHEMAAIADDPRVAEVWREFADLVDDASEMDMLDAALALDRRSGDIIDELGQILADNGMVPRAFDEGVEAAALQRAEALNFIENAVSGDIFGGSRAGDLVLVNRRAAAKAYLDELADMGHDSILMPHGHQGWTAIATNPDSLKQVGGNVQLNDLGAQVQQGKLKMAQDAAQLHVERMDRLGLDMNRMNGEINNVKTDMLNNASTMQQRIVELDDAVKAGQTERVQILSDYVSLGQKAQRAADEADRLTRIAEETGDQAAADMAASLRLGAQADAARARMFDVDADVKALKDGIDRAAIHGGFEDQAVKVMRAGMAPLSNNTQTYTELASVLRDVSKVIRREEMATLLKGWDWMTRLFKTYAILSPGFYFRNAFGGYFNNFLAGVKTSSYKQWFKAENVYHRAMRKGGTHEAALAKVDRAMGRSWGAAYRQVLDSQLLDAYDIVDDLMINQATKPGQAARRVGVIDNPVTRKGKQANKFVERMLRGSHALHMAKDGMNVDHMIDSVLSYHFDYEDLSRFERDVMRRIVPFYTWTRKNLPLQIEAVLTQPGKYGRLATIQRNLELGTEEEGIVPAWFKAEGGFRLPFGEDIYMIPDLPVKDLNSLNNPRRLLSGLSPLVKTPVELTTGKQLYNNRPFQEGYVAFPVSWQAMGLGVPMQAMGMARRDAQGNLVTRDQYLYALEQFMPLLGRARRLAPSEERYQDRLATTYLSFLFGLGVRTNTASEQTAELRRRGRKLDTMATDLESLGYGGYYQFSRDVAQPTGQPTGGR